MTISNLNNEIQFEPNILDWTRSHNRLSRFRSELKDSIDLLFWNDTVHETVKNWIRREISVESISNNWFWTQQVKNEKLEKAKSKFLETNSNKDFPPYSSNNLEAWLLAKDIEVEWSKKHWSHRLESLYLRRKDERDIVTCAMIRVKSQFLSFEIYQRLKAQEYSFDQLSWQFGEGPETRQGGRFIRQRIQNIPQPLRPLLRKISAGEVLKPHRMGDWFVILALEEFIPAEFNEITKEFLLNAEFESWLHAVTHHLVNQLKLVDPDNLDA